MSNYADDCSPYEYSYTTEEVIIKLEKDATFLIERYKNNYLHPNPKKWHLLLSNRRPTLCENWTTIYPKQCK